MSPANMIMIQIVQGDVAPRYESETTKQELHCEGVVITEKGTAKMLPLVDFKLRGADGKFYLFTLTGRIVTMINASLKSINLKNHGTEDP